MIVSDRVHCLQRLIRRLAAGGLCLAGGLLAADDGIYELRLEQAFEEYLSNVSKRYDGTLLIEIVRNSVVRAGAFSSTYGGINGYGHFRPAPGPFLVDASGLSVDGDQLVGLMHIDVPEVFNTAYPSSIRGTISCSLAVDLASGAGTYAGSSTLERQHEIHGRVSTSRLADQTSNTATRVNAWLLNPLADPLLPAREHHYSMMLNFTISGGDIGDMSAYEGAVRGSDDFDDTVYTALAPMLVSKTHPYTVHQGSAAVKDSLVEGEFLISGYDGNPEMTYSLDCAIYGTRLLGSYTLRKNGQHIKTGAIIGFAAPPWTPLVPLPAITPLSDARADPAITSRASQEYETLSLDKGERVSDGHPGFYTTQTPYWADHFGLNDYLYTPPDGFAGGSRRPMFDGPYYEKAENYLPRIVALLRYLRDTPYHGPFAWDFTLSHVSEGGNKTYDNGCFIGYGVAVSMALLAAVTDNEQERALARELYSRAGQWLLSITGGPLDLPGEYYKTRVWFTAWAGYAYIDLYSLTGEPRWLDAAKRFARAVTDIQQPSGSWTWADENSGETGSRTYSRESDEWYAAWEEISPAEFLYFLGRLRTECGVEEFVDAERKALDWMRRFQAATHLWVHNGEVGRFNVRQPAMLCLYLLECARDEDRDLALALTLARMCEEHAISWKREYGLYPHVAEPHLRAGSLGSRPNTASMTRLARAFIGLAHETGNDLWMAKAEALTHATLAIQNPDNGEIYQHSPWGPLNNSMLYKRNYHFYKAETALNLYHIGRSLNRLGALAPASAQTPATPDPRQAAAVDRAVAVRMNGRTFLARLPEGRLLSAALYRANGTAIVRAHAPANGRLPAWENIPAGIYILRLRGSRGNACFRISAGITHSGLR